MKKERQQFIALILFSLLFLGLTIGNMTNKEKEFSEIENRMLQTRPKITVKKVLNGTFQKEFESYLSDQFLWRDRWISYKTKAEQLFGKKEVKNVYLAKDNYLIEHHKKEDLDKKQYKKNTKRIKEVTNKYEKLLGKDRVRVLFVPTASSILRDKLPKNAPKDPQNDMLDEWKKVAKEGTFLDIRPLLNEKKDEYIYYKTDHHWTTLGAYYGYEAWAKSVGITPEPKETWIKEVVSNEFLGTIYSKIGMAREKDRLELWKEKEEGEYEIIYDMGQKTSDTFYEMSYAKKKDKYAVFLDGNHALTVVKNKKVQNGRKLVVVKDSYAHCFVPFVAKHFEEVHVIDLRYFNIGVEPYVKENKITDFLMLYHVMSYGSDTHTLNLVR